MAILKDFKPKWFVDENYYLNEDLAQRIITKIPMINNFLLSSQTSSDPDNLVLFMPPIHVSDEEQQRLRDFRLSINSYKVDWPGPFVRFCCHSCKYSQLWQDDETPFENYREWVKKHICIQCNYPDYRNWMPSNEWKSHYQLENHINEMPTPPKAFTEQIIIPSIKLGNPILL